MRRTASLLALPTVGALAVVTTMPALAAGDTSEGEPGEYSLSLDGLNDSGATGTALLTLGDDGSLTIEVESQGLAPGLPHAQHLHGDADLTQDFVCPTPEADADGDGFVSTAEGVTTYGGIHISLTTGGDTSPDSGLAVDRFPVADENGDLSYTRTLSAAELPQGTAAAIRNLHVVQHGVDINGNGEYDAEAGPSSLDPDLPLEATIPATCGLVSGSNISEIPEGGVDTGAGPVPAGSEPGFGEAAWLPVLLLVGLVAIGGVLAWVRPGWLRPTGR